MGAIATLTLNDGQATPVAHTFNPTSTRDAIALYHDRSGSIPVGYPSVSISMRKPTKASRAYKADIRIAVPTLEITSPSTGTGIQPAPTKAYDVLFVGELMLPERSTKAQRADLLAYAKNLLSNAVVKTLVEDLEEIY